MAETDKHVLTVGGLATLLDVLAGRGYRVVGPTRRDGAIVYDDLDGIDDLPGGWTEEQDGGRYRLVERGDGALFGYAVGPHSWKRYLHPPTQQLWHATRDGNDVRVATEPLPGERFAFLGVRACELQAIAVQDRVLMGDAHVDRHYEARRNGAFLVAVNCGSAGGTCFCVSMSAGPRAETGFDLALTEIVDDGDEHRFVLEAGSAQGQAVLDELPARPATTLDVAAAERVVARTAASMGRAMPAGGIRDLLQRNLDHPRWDEVAERCLSCANCTMVCPTCFCTTVEDASDLTGAETSRSRRWDSCFTLDFSYIHGGSVRQSTRSRYRQWMTHKLATGDDQFGMSGCVGCGRCITWCPVGIDITEEARAIHDTGRAQGMTMEGLERIVREHPFFADLDAEFCKVVGGCAKNVRFEAGQYLFHEGNPADQFYLLRQGRVALEVLVPGRGPVTFQTLTAGEIVGVSWLIPPYRWSYDAKALEMTRAIAMDAGCLRGKCEANHHLGYEMMKRFVPILIERLHATRMQILDVYGSQP